MKKIIITIIFILTMTTLSFAKSNITAPKNIFGLGAGLSMGNHWYSATTIQGAYGITDFLELNVGISNGSLRVNNAQTKCIENYIGLNLKYEIHNFVFTLGKSINTGQLERRSNNYNYSGETTKFNIFLRIIEDIVPFYSINWGNIEMDGQSDNVESNSSGILFSDDTNWELVIAVNNDLQQYTCVLGWYFM
ncbi:hypothetical protein ACFL2K_02850 [Candidatus Margulisiibacteriota bacterium]